MANPSGTAIEPSRSAALDCTGTTGLPTIEHRRLQGAGAPIDGSSTGLRRAASRRCHTMPGVTPIYRKYPALLGFRRNVRGSSGLAGSPTNREGAKE